MIWLIFYIISYICFSRWSPGIMRDVLNLIGDDPYFTTVRFSWVFKDKCAVTADKKTHVRIGKHSLSLALGFWRLREDALLFGECHESRRWSHRDCEHSLPFPRDFYTFAKAWTRRDYFEDDVLNLGQRLGTSSPENRRWQPSWRVCRFRCK